MWKGVISFGMVSIPIRLYVATESHSVSFHQLCPEHHARIKYRRWCPVGDHEVNYGEVERGYEVGDERYAIIEEKDLENLPLPTSRAIEINEFVPKGEIPAGLYFKNAYYIEPEEAGRKPYYLLKAALEDTERVAIAKIALRDVRDGASNTLLLGETLPSQNRHMQVFHWYSTYGTQLNSTIIPINYPVDEDDTSWCGANLGGPQHSMTNNSVAWGFRSRHAGGANFAFVDGSIHFIMQDIDYKTYQLLGCRNDGQAVPFWE